MREGLGRDLALVTAPVLAMGAAWMVWRQRSMLDRTWFSELSELWPGQAMSLQMKKVILRTRSKFQDILVFDSTDYGRVMCLDGVIQCTERDEHAYQEMMAHAPLFSHPKPVKVLVVGGGDGGVLREIAKHPSVKEIHICEIDEQVISISREHLPQLGVGFDDKRVQIHIECGAAFMKRHKGEFDVIVCDTSDPVGPAASLFSNSFYTTLHEALTENGVVASQGECMWLHAEMMRELINHAKSLFKDVGYLSISIPTYPCGQIGALLCCKGKSRALKPRPCDLELMYYDEAVHLAAGTLPRFARRALYGKA